MILLIKGIRKWRVTRDELNWIIQEKKPNNKPPNDWVNRFYFSELENMVSALADLGIADEKLSDFKGILTRQRELKQGIRRLIQSLAKEMGAESFQLPDIPSLSAAKKTPKKKASKSAKSKKKKAK